MFQIGSSMIRWRGRKPLRLFPRVANQYLIVLMGGYNGWMNWARLAAEENSVFLDPTGIDDAEYLPGTPVTRDRINDRWREGVGRKARLLYSLPASRIGGQIDLRHSLPTAEPKQRSDRLG